MYSIIKTIDYLEYAYITGKIKGPEYDSECKQLLHQFNLSQQAIQGFKGIDAFFQEYELMNCHDALSRIKAGKSGYNGEDADSNVRQRIFDITTKIISALDVVAMGITSVDQLTPYIRDIQMSLNNYPNLPQNFAGTGVIKKWIDILALKAATDELQENEIRQLKFDIDNVYNEFKVVLGMK
eukprot:403374957